MAAYMICTMTIHDPVTFRKYNDPEYQRLSEFRRAATTNSRMILQEGRADQVAPDPRV